MIEWRCVGEYKPGRKCGTLLAHLDPESNVVFIKSGGDKTWIYDVGGSAVRRQCRDCLHINWLFSKDLTDAQKAQIRSKSR